MALVALRPVAAAEALHTKTVCSFERRTAADETWSNSDWRKAGGGRRGREEGEISCRPPQWLHVMRWAWPSAPPPLSNNLSEGARQRRLTTAVHYKGSRCRILRHGRRSRRSCSRRI